MQYNKVYPPKIYLLVVIALIGNMYLAPATHAQNPTTTLKPIKVDDNQLIPLDVLMKPLSTQGYTRPAEPLPPTLIAAINRPATVQVLANFTGNLQYQQLLIYTDNLRQAVAQIETSALIGNLPNNNADKLMALLTLIQQNPHAFLTPDNSITQEQINIGATGSGLIITPQGHLVTNAHVVATDEASLAQKLLSTGFFNRVGELAKYLQSTYPQPNGLSEPATQLLLQIMETFYTSRGYFKLANITGRYRVLTGYTLQNPGYHIEANLLAIGQPIPGKDVAILKLQTTQNNWPTISFGPDRELRSGDEMYVLGYPGVVNNNEVLDQNVMRQPSFTEGKMSARQKTKGGWEAIQITAAVGRGNSGGPVFNKYGEVIGILTFGSQDASQGGALVQGFNFIVPNSIIHQFIHQAGLTPTLSNSATTLRQALQWMADKKYKKAAAALNEIKSSFAQFPYLNEELNDATTKAASEKNTLMDYWDNMDTKTQIMLGLAAVIAVGWVARKLFSQAGHHPFIFLV